MNLLKRKWLYFLFSGLLIIPGTISLFTNGLRLGIDFTGGTLLELKLEKAQSGTQVSQSVESSEKEQILKLVGTDAQVSTITKAGDQVYLLRTKPLDKDQVEKLKKDLEPSFGKVTQNRLETVGPTIGQELLRNSFISMGIATLAIVLYIAFSFREVPRPASSWKFGLTAIAALLHDVLLVIGVFSLLGKYYNVEIDSLFVTALLTIIGFSVHDTIVVYDRIRENLKRRLPVTFEQVANRSIVETLGRSISTSLTVVLVLTALLLFGGSNIKWFVVALLVGIVSGTYSSIFNATPLLVVWQNWTNRKK